MYKGYTEYGNPSGIEQKPADIIKTNGDSSLALQDESLMRHAEMHKDGQDLVLETPKGQTIIQDYYASENAPNLVGADGRVLSPQLVDSFLKSDPQYADSGSLSDESPVGSIQELNGPVTITRLDGSVESAEIGSSIYQGDIVETAPDAAVNITFIDETNFAVSSDSRLSIDEYVFDPSSNEGKSDFSILKGLFVYTSGLIGREDPDDVNIDTPMGSIGIRGTIIAGNADSGEITVVEGAIVLRDLHGNEMTLANQFETAIFEPAEMRIRPLGQLGAEEVSDNFDGVSGVAGDLFSSLQDAANDEQAPAKESVEPEDSPAEEEAAGTDESHGEEESSEEKSVDATDTLMQGEGSNGENIVALNETTETIGELQNALGQLGRPRIRPQDRIILREDDLPVVALGDRNFSPFAIDNDLPTQFFATTTNTLWSYDFSNIFQDPDGDTLSYFLTQNTITQLQNSNISGLISINSQPSFSNGVLTLDIDGIFNGTRIDLEIFATDGELGTIYREDFTFYSSTPLTNASSAGFSGFLKTYREDSSYHELTDGTGGTVDQSYTRIFLNNSGSSFNVYSDNNEIHMGENGSALNGRTVQLQNNATDNFVIGGTKGDRVIVHNSDNIVETLDGNDNVTLVVSQPLVGSELNIDMGGNERSHAEAFAKGLNVSNPNLTLGDHIQLAGNGSLDLSNVGQLKGIETLEFDLSQDQDVTLSVQTIFDMSDSHTLVIGTFGTSGMGSDSDIDLVGGIWAGRDVDGNSTTDTTNFNGRTYNIFDGDDGSGNTVTLLVDSAIDTTAFGAII